MRGRRRFLKGLAATSIIPHTLAGDSPRGQNSRKVLLDTDIGSDIDDAVALAYLLREPRCKLLGITTVSGDARGRALLAGALCLAAGKSVPIYPGAESPLIIPQRQTAAPQTQRLTQPSLPPRSGDAVDFLSATIRAHPHEIDLLAIGPLTNVARLFQRDPETAALLRSLVMMGGKYSDYPTPWGPTEWNAIVDPHAIDQVFAAPLPAVSAFGLDITWQLFLEPAAVARRFRDDALLEIVLDWSRVWFEERDLLHFHDPLAAVSLFHERICTFKRGRISVDLAAGPEQGVTHFQELAAGPHRVAASVDPGRFFAAYFETFYGARAGPPPGAEFG